MERKELSVGELISQLREIVASVDYSSALFMGSGDLSFEEIIYNFGKIKSSLAVDTSEERLSAIERKSVKKLKGNMVKEIQQIKDKKYDVVSLLDAIEHVSKDNAVQLLEQCERVAKKLVVIFTPIQPNLGDNEKLCTHDDIAKWTGEKVAWEHLSVWKPEEFEELGYNVIYDDKYHDRRTNGEIPWGTIIAYKKI